MSEKCLVLKGLWVGYAVVFKKALSMMIIFQPFFIKKVNRIVIHGEGLTQNI